MYAAPTAPPQFISLVAIDFAIDLAFDLGVVAVDLDEDATWEVVIVVAVDLDEDATWEVAIVVAVDLNVVASGDSIAITGFNLNSLSENKLIFGIATGSLSENKLIFGIVTGVIRFFFFGGWNTSVSWPIDNAILMRLLNLIK